MQPETALPDDLFPMLEGAIERARLSRYLPAAGGSRRTALAFYAWNLSLCESFVVPLHYAEIVTRNALHRGLVARAGAEWFNDRTFRRIMEDRLRDRLDLAISLERRRHRREMTAHHVVSALSFGFWQHLTTKRFDRYLWTRGIHGIFPGAPPDKTCKDLGDLIHKVRTWRNRIAHHEAIFDKEPMRNFQDALTLLRWSSPETFRYVAAISKVPMALQARPR